MNIEINSTTKCHRGSFQNPEFYSYFNSNISRISVPILFQDTPLNDLKFIHSQIPIRVKLLFNLPVLTETNPPVFTTSTLTKGALTTTLAWLLAMVGAAAVAVMGCLSTTTWVDVEVFSTNGC